MANPGRDRPFFAFNPSADDRQRQPEQAPSFGRNPFNRAIRANRPAGTYPPFVFDPVPREQRWNLRVDGQWGLNMNAQRRPNRVAAYEADQGYARFQARAFGLPQAPPQAPDVAALPGNGAIPPPPPAPAPPAPGGEAQPGRNQEADPPAILLGRNGNAGMGRELDVPPVIRILSLGRDLLGHVRAAAAAVAGFTNAAALAVDEVARPLVHFASRWAVFIFFVAFFIWASIPAVVRVLVAVHRSVVVLLVTLVEVLSWALNMSIRWPRDSLVSYTLRPEYTSRAVTGMALLEPGICPAGDGSRGPPYGATVLSSADITKLILPYPFSLPPIRAVWTILWSLLVAPVSAALWALGAALAIDLEIFPSEDDQ